MTKDNGNCLSSQLGGRGDLKVLDCVDEYHQAFTFCESSELFNDIVGYYVGNNDLNGSGNIHMFACDNKDDQCWKKVLKGRDPFSLTSFKTIASSTYGDTIYCMRVDSTNVASHECNNVD